MMPQAAEEGLVDVVADLPADSQPPESVQQGDGLVDDPVEHARARTMSCTAAAIKGVPDHPP
jgi:hypothetical protein